jgi:hypothetical protein
MMKSSYGLVRDWVIKKMNLDEQIFKRLDKQILNQPMHENVIPRFLNKILKGQSLLPFFYVCTINLQ